MDRLDLLFRIFVGIAVASASLGAYAKFCLALHLDPHLGVSLLIGAICTLIGYRAAKM